MDFAAAFGQIGRHRTGNRPDGETRQKSPDDHLFDTVGARLQNSTDNSHSVAHDDGAAATNFHSEGGNDDGREEGREIIPEPAQRMFL